MNTFVGGSSGRKQSRLVELMRSFSASHSGQSFGFRPHAEHTRRTTALVASFPAGDLDALAAAVEAGADAVEVRVESAQALEGLRGVADRLKVPFGITLPADAGSEAAAHAVEIQADWIRLPIDAHISTMDWEKPSRVLTVPFELDLDVAHGINGLAVDAVLLDQAPNSSSEFTYAAALRFRALSELIKKPLLLHAGPGVPPSAAAASKYLGADALLVDLEGLRSIEMLRAYLRALEIAADSKA